MATRPRRTNLKAAGDRTAPTKAPATKAAKAPRTKPIRVTLDLEPKQHMALKQWCNAAAVETQLPNVSLATVYRILGDLLVTDDAIAEQVQARLEDGAG